MHFQNVHKTLFQSTVDMHFQNAHNAQKLRRLALCAFMFKIFDQIKKKIAKTAQIKEPAMEIGEAYTKLFI